VVAKIQFFSSMLIDPKCQLMFNSINRGWLNASSSEYVLKIPGA
jgi:hypothetical protein